MPEMQVKQGGRIRDEIESRVRGEMRVMGVRGDVRVTWNARDTDEVEAARAQFDELRDKRFVAYRVDESGRKGEQITEFDPAAQKIILAPPMAGGAEKCPRCGGSGNEPGAGPTPCSTCGGSGQNPNRVH